MNNEISSLRNEYTLSELDVTTCNKNPFKQFEKWFDQVKQVNIKEPNAMVLSTCSIERKPSQRVVLLKGFNEKGFEFYTNYESNKAKDIVNNHQVSVLFPWLELERQLIISGTIKKISVQKSKTYFYSRPRGSQIGAWASCQSAELVNRKMLEKKWKELEQKYTDQVVPYPEFWGGYLIQPTFFEFWQGRSNRLHDRIVYVLDNKQTWIMKRLSP